MKSGLTDLYYRLFTDYCYDFSSIWGTKREELRCYLDYNTHNGLITEENGRLSSRNLNNMVVSDITLDGKEITFIPRGNYDNKYFSKSEYNDVVAFIANRTTDNDYREKNYTIRTNNNGFSIEVFDYYNTDITNNKIMVALYDKAAMRYLQQIFTKEGIALPYEQINPVSFTNHLIDSLGGIKNVDIVKIREKYIIEPDKRIELQVAADSLVHNHKPENMNEAHFKIDIISIMDRGNLKPSNLPKYQPRDGFYTTFMKYMLEQGYYHDESLEMIAKPYQRIKKSNN